MSATRSRHERTSGSFSGSLVAGERSVIVRLSSGPLVTGTVVPPEPKKQADSLPAPGLPAVSLPHKHDGPRPIPPAGFLSLHCLSSTPARECPVSAGLAATAGLRLSPGEAGTGQQNGECWEKSTRQGSTGQDVEVAPSIDMHWIRGSERLVSFIELPDLIASTKQRTREEQFLPAWYQKGVRQEEKIIFLVRLN